MAKLLRSEPGKLHPLKCDVSKESDIKEAFKWVKSNLGVVDILINNAGVCDFNTLIGKFP
jgi:NADP+-dependent farnesol dehydrogenase